MNYELLTHFFHPPGARSSNVDDAIMEKVVEAIRESDEKTLRNILDSNADIDLDDQYDGAYPLHMCVGQLNCVKVLLEHGASPDIQDLEGKRPIHYAAERDFVETLMYLVLNGADYDTPVVSGNSDMNGMTPLDIAFENDAFACQDFLHFLGAKIHRHTILDEDAKSKYDIIQKGYADGKIIHGGITIKANTGRPHDVVSRDGKSVDIGLQGYGDSFIVYIRRMEVDYQSSSTRIPLVSIQDGMELVSDIYQYKVDRNAQCDLHIPVVEGLMLDKYNNLVVVHMTDFEQTSSDVYTNVDIVGNKMIIKGMTLCSYGSSPIVSFGIFTNIKTDNISRDPNEELKVNSTVENLFEVTVPAGIAPTCTQIQLQVIKSSVENSSDSIDDNDEDYGNSSDFLSVASVSTQTSRKNSIVSSHNPPLDTRRPVSAASRQTHSEENLNIQLPKPRDEKGKIQVVVKCQQGQDGTEPMNWVKHEQYEVSGRVVKCKEASFANYIVVNVKKFGHLIKEFVSELYTRALGNKKEVRLFAMVKQVNRLEYIVKIVLCESDVYPNRLQSCLKDGFQEQECGPTDSFEINTKCTFMLKLLLKNAEVSIGPDTLPIQYQGNHPKSQDFPVDAQDSDTKSASGRCLMFKNAVPKKEASFYGKKCITTLALRFGSCKIDCIPNDKFLSDNFIEDVANRTIGFKWFSLGVHLGFSCEELFALQDIEPRKRNAMILYKWRDEQASSLDEKLDNLIIATKAAELPKLKSELCQAVSKFRQGNSILESWIQKYQGSDTSLDLRSVQQKTPSPYSDKFLLYIAEQLGGIDERLFIDLDLTVAEREEMQTGTTYQRCKLLMLARDKSSSDIAFLKKLKGTLSKQNLNLQLLEISECANKWLSTEEAQHVEKKKRDAIKEVFK